MTVDRKEPRLVDVSSCPVIYADGLAKVVVEGHNARLTFFEYRTIGTERIMMPVLEMVRPVASCNADEVIDKMVKSLRLTNTVAPAGLQ